MSRYLLLSLLLSTQMAGSVRVIDRFPGGHLPIPKRCLISIFETMTPTSFNEMAEKELRPFAKKLQQMNCSFVIGRWTGAGSLQANDSYDGCAGMIQRNEVDTMTGFFRSDFFSVLPGFVASTGMPADVLIISHKNSSIEKQMALVEVWMSAFDPISIQYSIICIIIFVVIHSICTIHSLSVPSFLRHCLSGCYEVVAALLDQEHFDPRSFSSRVIVLFFNLFVFFGVHCITMGSLNADLVAFIDPPVIEELSEFSNTSYTQPVIIQNLYLPPVLEKATTGSELWNLKQVLDAHPEENRAAMRSDDSEWSTQQVSKLLDGLDKSKKALLAPCSTVRRLRPIGCLLKPDLMQQIATSKKTFANSVFLLLMSRTIDPDLRKVFEYLMMTAAETEIYEGVIRSTVRFMKENSMSESRTSDCDKAPQRQHDPQPFSSATFEPIFLGYYFACLATSLYAISEIVFYCVSYVIREMIRKSHQQKRKGEKRRRRTQRVRHNQINVIHVISKYH